MRYETTQIFGGRHHGTPTTHATIAAARAAGNATPTGFDIIDTVTGEILESSRIVSTGSGDTFRQHRETRTA